MAIDTASEFRARATQARRISDNMHSCEARIELRDMAAALDAEADRLESSDEPDPSGGL